MLNILADVFYICAVEIKNPVIALTITGWSDKNFAV